MYLLQVYVTNASLNVNRPFTYLSECPVERFCRVKVQFHESYNVAIVISCEFTDKSKEELEEEKGFELLKIQEIIDEDPVISEELFDLASWLSRTTISPFISCLNSMLPKTLKTVRDNQGPKMVRKLHKNNGDFQLTKRQREVYDEIYEGMEAAEARKISTSIIKKLIDIKAIEEYEEEAVFVNREIDQTSFKKLTTEQEKAYEDIISTDK